MSMCTVSPVISDGERLLILDNTYVNDSSVGTSVRLQQLAKLIKAANSYLSQL